MKTLPFLIGSCAISVGLFFVGRHFWKTVEAETNREAGDPITSYRDVPVRSNGADYTVSHGKHYADDGYYYGQKWQCVEYVKRFYHDAFDHHMPDVWGHARDFFDPKIPTGELNSARGMLQFMNGGTVAPEPDDLLVFDFEPFGHVAVVTAVRENEIEVIQQNVGGRPRSTHQLEKRGKFYFVKASRDPAGWLRLPAKAATQ